MRTYIASFTTLKQDNMGLYPRELTLALQVVLLILAGEFCEVTLETPCKDGWFGIPSIGICGPCMCDVGLHLSPVCNRTTGECYCKVREHRWLHAWPNDWANHADTAAESAKYFVNYREPLQRNVYY